jgi:hypothetical protein
LYEEIMKGPDFFLREETFQEMDPARQSPKIDIHKSIKVEAIGSSVGFHVILLGENLGDLMEFVTKR